MGTPSDRPTETPWPCDLVSLSMRKKDVKLSLLSVPHQIVAKRRCGSNLWKLPVSLVARETCQVPLFPLNPASLYILLALMAVTAIVGIAWSLAWLKGLPLFLSLTDRVDFKKVKSMLLKKSFNFLCICNRRGCFGYLVAGLMLPFFPRSWYRKTKEKEEWVEIKG